MLTIFCAVYIKFNRESFEISYFLDGSPRPHEKLE